jgi:hypothetical protein
MPKSFELTCNKGYYHHFCNTAENLDYVGSYPAPNYYGADYMSGDEGDQFFKWHKKQKSKIFRNKEEFGAYCMDDNNVLRHAARLETCFFLIALDVPLSAKYNNIVHLQ